jgi:hypothetical protein
MWSGSEEAPMEYYASVEIGTRILLGPIDTSSNSPKYDRAMVSPGTNTSVLFSAMHDIFIDIGATLSSAD